MKCFKIIKQVKSLKVQWLSFVVLVSLFDNTRVYFALVLTRLDVVSTVGMPQLGLLKFQFFVAVWIGRRISALETCFLQRVVDDFHWQNSETPEQVFVAGWRVHQKLLRHRVVTPKLAFWRWLVFSHHLAEPRLEKVVFLGILVVAAWIVLRVESLPTVNKTLALQKVVWERRTATSVRL